MRCKRSYLLASVLSVVIVPAAPVLATGVTLSASVSATGAQANGGGINPVLSADGRFVAFFSPATDILPTNGAFHVFLHSLETRATELIDVSSSGEEANNGSPGWVTMSGDGGIVVFLSTATNLVPDDTNGRPDLFLRNRRAGTTERLLSDVNVIGVPAPVISGNGRFIVFVSRSNPSNQTQDIFVFDRETGEIERISVNRTNTVVVNRPAISDDGRFVAFGSTPPDSMDNAPGLYIRDRQRGITEYAGTGFIGDPAISGDGRFVVAYPGGPELFVYDRQTQSLDAISPEGVGVAGYPAISADGRFIAFYGGSIPATDAFADIFLHDRQTRRTERVSVDSEGRAANDASFFPAISADGRIVAFQSGATNLVPDDTNNQVDIFVRILSTPDCPGDCSADGEVTVDELVTMVNIALGTATVSECSAGNTNGDDAITIDEIVAAVNNALQGCGA
jgi:Tol biopolymer transport system component